MINPKHKAEWIASGVAEAIIDLNVESVSGAQLFLRYCPEPKHKNGGGLTAEWARRLANCEKSSGWWVEGVDPISGQPMEWGRLKPDPKSPIAIDYQKGGIAKYKSPIGVKSRLTFLRPSLPIWEAIARRYGVEIEWVYQVLGPDGFWCWVLAHPELPIILTEGEKKAGCLLSNGYIAIALPGIWMGRRIQKDANGLKVSESLVSDLELFTQSGRTFYFSFDTDRKPKTVRTVNRAIQKTGKLLIDKGCQVKVVTLPLLENGKGAVDDFIVAKGVFKFNELVNQADDFDYWQFKAEQQQRLTYPPFITVNTPRLSTLNLNIPNHGIIALDSAKGTEKSKTIEKNTKDNPVLLTGHRIFLMRDLCKRWELDYREDLEKIKGLTLGSDGDIADRIGTCTESLLSVPIPENFTLVLDEVDQVILSALTSDTCNKDGKRPVILARFEEIIRKAQRVIIASADVSDKEVNYLKKIKGLDTPVYVIKNEYIPNGYPVEIFDTGTYQALIDDLLLAVLDGLKIWVPCDSIKLSQQLSALIKSQFPESRILLVNSKTSGGDEQQAFINTLNDKNTNTVDLYNVVITTQSMATGVSDETGKFDAVFGFFTGVSSDSDIAQSLARQRYPVPRYIWVSKVGKFKNSFGSSHASKIKRDLITKFQANQKLLSEFNPTLKDHQWGWEDNPHLDLYCQYIEQENRSKYNLRNRVIYRLKLEGNQVSVVNADDVNPENKELLKQIREQIKQDNYKLLKQAREIDTQEAERLNRTAILNPEDEAALEAFHLKQFYKVDELTDQLLDFDKDGRTRTKVIRFELLQHGLTTAAQRDLRNIERQAKHGRGCFLPDLSSYSLGVKVRELMGIKDFLIPGQKFTNDDLEPLAEFCRQNSKAIALAIGLKIPDELPSNIWLFRKVCEQLGIKTAAQRKGRKQIRSVWIEEDNWEFFTGIITRRQLMNQEDVVRSPISIPLQETLQHTQPIPETPPDEIRQSDPNAINEAIWVLEHAAKYKDEECLGSARQAYESSLLQQAAAILKQRSLEMWLWVKDSVVRQNNLGFNNG